MIKVVKTVVDQHRRLLGLVLEGRDRQFGGISNERVQKPVALDTLKKINFNNRQVSITPQGIQELGKFRLNQLPMVAVVDNNYINVDNRIRISHKFEKDNQIIGFTVNFADGSQDNFTYPNVIQLSTWFRPDNFIVGTSSTGRKYVYGKPGMLKIEQLPTTDLSNGKDNKSKPKAAKTSAQHVRKTGMFNNVVDIIDIYEELRKCDGLLIHLPNEKYTPASGGTTEAGDGFMPLGVGDYAYPTLSFSRNKLNANANFRKPGTVMVDFGGGAVTPVQSFTYNTKSIFLDAENYIKRFGVAIPQSYENDFSNALGSSLSIKKINNTQMIQAIMSLTGKSNYVFYEVDTGKIDLISTRKYDSYRLSAQEIKQLLEENFNPWVISKYLSPTYGLGAEIKKTTNIDYNKISGKDPLVLYSAMGEAFRDKISAAGIDIYSGAYVKRQNIIPKVPKGAPNKEPVTIEYRIVGRDPNSWSYKKIEEAINKGGGLPKEVLDTCTKIKNIKDTKEQVIQLNKVYKKCDKRVYHMHKLLWLHKCVTYLEGGKSTVHSHEPGLWTPYPRSRSKKFKVYNCVEPGYEDLVISIANVDI